MVCIIIFSKLRQLTYLFTSLVTLYSGVQCPTRTDQPPDHPRSLRRRRRRIVARRNGGDNGLDLTKSHLAIAKRLLLIRPCSACHSLRRFPSVDFTANKSHASYHLSTDNARPATLVERSDPCRVPPSASVRSGSIWSVASCLPVRHGSPAQLIYM